MGREVRRTHENGRCSSRSAQAPRSRMPGMMDTVLNLGHRTSKSLKPHGGIEKTGNAAPGLGLLPPLHQHVRRCRHGASDHDFFEEKIEQRLEGGQGRRGRDERHRSERGAAAPGPVRALQDGSCYREHIGRGRSRTDRPGSSCVWASSAVFKSWNIKRAVTYRAHQQDRGASRGHGRQRPDDGLRQHRAISSGDGRLLHARPGDRRENVFYGEFLHQRPGRGRRRGHP